MCQYKGSDIIKRLSLYCSQRVKFLAHLFTTIILKWRGSLKPSSSLRNNNAHGFAEKKRRKRRAIIMIRLPHSLPTALCLYLCTDYQLLSNLKCQWSTSELISNGKGSLGRVPSNMLHPKTQVQHVAKKVEKKSKTPSQ